MKPLPTCFRAVRVIGWRHRSAAKNAIAVGRKATVALTTTFSTMIDNSQDPVVDHTISQLAATAHVPVDVMHMYLKTVFAFFAVFVTL